MMATNFPQIVVLFVCLCGIAALPEPGVWDEVDYPKDTGYLYYVKSLYKDSIISVTIQCTDCEKDAVTVHCVLRYTPCTREYYYIADKTEERTISTYLEHPDVLLFPNLEYKTVEYISITETQVGHSGYIQLEPKLDQLPEISNSSQRDAKASPTLDGDQTQPAEGETGSNPGSKPESAHSNEIRRKRAATGEQTKTRTGETNDAEKPSAEATSKTTVAPKEAPVEKGDAKPAQQGETPVSTTIAQHQSGALLKTWRSGYYLFILRIDSQNDKSTFKVSVSMKGSIGYISAIEWPLLIFYGVMGLVYIFLGAMWLVMLACNWRDLLRVQYWIGAVILLGMLEKAVFYGDFQSIANNGKSWTEGVVVFAEIVSCLKRALARMLVIIVSLGFGIVKPRLGSTLHKVLFVGGLYFLLATVEGCIRGLKPRGDQSTDMMLAAIPLAIVDASICWWIFSSLVQTVRQLRLRRNIVKLTLYRHFTNTLVFAVIASIIFMVWSIIQIKTDHCIKDWQEMWIDDAFWHLLFSVILLVIMILWRPSTNNQRYAFSPLLDHGDDEEEEETVMNDAFDGMKMRPKQVNGSPKQKQNTIEDELKWVEENIPSAISDTAQSILESDEEIMTAKYEISKMQ